jgi:thiamine-phosphate diphosphorylase
VTRLRLPPLYAIVDPLETGRDPAALAAAYLAGGARLLQLRLKSVSSRELYEAARRLRGLTHDAGAALVVNDRPDVAAAIGADGVHLGQDDVPDAVARTILGPDRWIGVSTHDLDEARAAVAAGADYLGVGPVFDTTSKRAALPARGHALVRAVRALTDRPLVAIGGITPETAASVIDAGADAVAMIGALTHSDDPAATVRRILTDLGSPDAASGGA